MSAGGPLPGWIEPAGPDTGWRSGVRARLTTKPANLGLSVGDDPEAVWQRREAFEAALGGRCQWLDQVHGVEVIRATRREVLSGRGLPKADAVWTDEEGIGCVVQMADCLPLLAAQADRVGAAHAGWRGLCGGVGLALLSAMARPGEGELHLWMGPCIGPRSFEVGPEVTDAFRARWGEQCPGLIEPRHPLNPASENDFSRHHVDLQQILQWQIENWSAEQNISLIWIEMDKRCTVESDTRLFSHRRVQNTVPILSSSPEKPGRMAAGIIRQSAYT